MKLTLNEDTLFEDGLKVKTAQIRKWLKKNDGNPKSKEDLKIKITLNEGNVKKKTIWKWPQKQWQFFNEKKKNWGQPKMKTTQSYSHTILRFAQSFVMIKLYKIGDVNQNYRTKFSSRLFFLQAKFSYLPCKKNRI